MVGYQCTSCGEQSFTAASQLAYTCDCGCNKFRRLTLLQPVEVAPVPSSSVHDGGRTFNVPQRRSKVRPPVGDDPESCFLTSRVFGVLLLGMLAAFGLLTILTQLVMFLGRQ